MAIKLIEKKTFRESLVNPQFYRKVARPIAYAMSHNDPERVHEMALKMLSDYKDVVLDVSDNFNFPRLHVKLGKNKVLPFGPAEGLDKNGVALDSLSFIFGFVPFGTVPVKPREGNARPRVAIDKDTNTVYNAQGFPSEGLNNILKNIEEYDGSLIMGNKPLLTSVCGIPESEDLSVSYSELKTLVTNLNPYSHGFIWNPFSPNTTALSALRTPEVFYESARLIREISGKEKLNLVKMGPYEVEEKERWLELVGAFISGGGEGIIAVNTYKVSKEEVPKKNWGYPSAGKSGPFLQEYRQRAIKDTRQAFPKSIIIGAGGSLFSVDDTWSAFEKGANALVSYTTHIFNGFGVIPEISKGLERKLDEKGFNTLEEFQKETFGI